MLNCKQRLAFLSLFICLLGLPTFLTAQAVFSVKSGSWGDPTIWSADSVPGAGVDVIISTGDSVEIPFEGAGGEAATLKVEENAILLLNDRSFTVHGTMEVAGAVVDTSNSGTNIFGGLVHILPGGWWNTDSILSNSRLLFRGGIRNESDTIFIYRGTFDQNDQTISGTGPVRISGTVIVETGLSLTLDNSGGVVLTEAGEFRGRETGEQIINKSLLVNMGTRDAISRAIPDFTSPGNIVASGGNTTSRITQAIYENLVILPDTGSNFLRRRAQGPIEVQNRLWIQPGAQFSSETYPFVAKRVDVNGVFYSPDSTARIDIDSLDISGGTFDGNSGGWPQVYVHEHLGMATAGGQFGETELHVETKLDIPTGRTMVFTDEAGPKYFQDVHIHAGGVINYQAEGTRVTYQGKVHVEGLLSQTSGVYRFEDSVQIDSIGTLAGRGVESLFVFGGAFIQNGTMDNSRGIYVFRENTYGTGVISIQGDVIIPEGETLTNYNEGGLSIDGTLNGLDANSMFVNAGRLVLRPKEEETLPMVTGIFDPISVPGNWVEFASASSNQKIPAGQYQSISVIAGSPKLITNGDLEIKGDMHLESNLERDPFSLDLAHTILNGTGNQVITGTGEAIIQALDVVKDSGVVLVNNAFVAQETISLLKGEVKTINSFVGLSSFAVITETDQGYITGKLATTRNIGGGSTNEFGGMGLSILADRDQPLGQTLVVRTTGSSVEPDQIERYFEITPTFNERLNAKVNFFYNDRDLAGAKEKELILVRQGMGNSSFEELDSKNFYKDNELVDFFIDEFGTIGAQAKTLRVKAYPSPFRGEETVTVEYWLPFDSPVSMSVYDRAGRLIYRDSLDGLTGPNSAEIPPLSSRAGTYYVHIHTSLREGYAKIFKLAY